MVNPPKRSLYCMALLLLTLAPGASVALQPLEVFAAGARERNPTALEARAGLRERGAEADVALGRVLPGISFDGQYAHNQYSSEIDLGALGGPSRTIVLLPKNQWNGTATVTVPLVDLANFQRIGAARAEAEAAARQLEAMRLEVEAQVAQSYYQLVANVALVAASTESLEVSREGLRLAEEHYRVGTGALLETDRARAEVEQRVQQVASAELQVALAARALLSGSSVDPDLSSSVELEFDARPQPPLPDFEQRLAGVLAVLQ